MTRLTDQKYAKHKNAWLNHIASLEAALTKRNERIAFLEATITELENAAQPAPETETKDEAVNLPKPNADHYEYTGETIEHATETLYRIRSKIDRPHHGVKAGYEGGWISPRAALGRDAWIADNAKVHHDAWVGEKAWVGDNAVIYSDVDVHGEAHICGSTIVYVNAKICGTTILDGDVIVIGKPYLAGDLRISGNAIVEEATWPRN